MGAAEYSRSPEVAKFLIEAGADLSVKDINGRTIKELAKNNDNEDVRKIFEEAE
ncbi:MAG: hypothetical protein IJM82_08310 [Synergistaceae bacterium]|nr:hypothetical protein [Synergistaceae bacterium]